MSNSMRTLGKNRIDQEDQWDHCNKSDEINGITVTSQKNLMGSL